MSKDETYNGWKNRETWCFHMWITNEEPLYKLTVYLLKALRNEKEIQQVDIDFGMVAHAIIQALHEYIAYMNTSNEEKYRPYVENWMKLRSDTGDISKVDKPELSEALMELIE